MKSIRHHAEAIASNPAVGSAVGISPTLILEIAQIAIPMLIRCWMANRASVSPPTESEKAAELKQLAESHWLADRGTYDRHLIHRMRLQVSKAAERAGNPLWVEQVDHVSVGILDRARLSEPDEIGECLTEVATIDLSKE